MATTETAAALGQLDGRDVAALTEGLLVDPLPKVPGMVDVYSDDGERYRVDVRDGACQCPDHRYRGVQCKHIKRAMYRRGEREVPTAVDPTAIDPVLREHLDLGIQNRTPGLEATDGEDRP